MRHGQATEATISLRANDGTVSLSVADNGVGFPRQLPERRGLGLSIMQFRARMIGAKLDIAPNPAGGTLVMCSFSQNSNPQPAV